MVSKLKAQFDDQKKQFNSKIYQSKRRGQPRNFYDQNHGQKIIKIDIYQIVEIGDYHSVVEYNTDRITETDQSIIRTIDMILEEEILEGIFDQIKNYRGQNIEVDTEETIETIIMKR